MPNRLAQEASPYLQQHANNPVDWWPWCENALAEAKKRDVPILLSIGYSACHWCHVMERESFEDAATATLMNEHFVNIKVDREERPDLDQIYQLVVQLLGRNGGWPLTVFLTPDQEPFFGGTYFPPVDRYGMPSFQKVLLALAETYREKRAEIGAQAYDLTRAISEVSRGRGDEAVSYLPAPDLLERASRPLLRRVDTVHAGFGSAPKFPNTMPLEILLRRGVLEGDDEARDAARKNLEAMRKGGIWDHLGGGFHRYSTDARWVVPHFEKMLYDNALLLRVYVDAARAFQSPLFEEVARSIASYVAREMTDPEGGFYASQDADSEGEEGKFFVWDPGEVRSCAGADAAVAIAYFGITEEGNFEEHGRATFKTVLHEARPLAAFAAGLDLDLPAAEAALGRAKRAMSSAREERPKPFRDEKILTSWSSLMITALAEAGVAFGDRALLSSAERALAFVTSRLLDEGRALRLAKGDLVKGPGFLDDHAFLANALIDVYEATGDPAHVALARGLADTILARFYTGEGFFFTAIDSESLITRPRDAFDNAIPSGTAIACRVLLRLGALVDPKFATVAEAELTRLAPRAVANPFGYGQVLCELDRLVRGSVDVVLVGARDDARTIALRDAVYSAWLPNRVLAWLDPNHADSRAACAVLAEGKSAGATPIAYVCRGRACSLPLAEPTALREELAGGARPRSA